MNKLLIVLIFIIGTYQSTADDRREFCESVSRPIKCDPCLKYRLINGRCNNLENPYYGAANTKLIRFMKSRYADGVSVPPKSVTGAELPSARLISLEVFNDTKKQNVKYTHGFMQFGQLVAHDIANILKVPKQRGCCNENGQLVYNPDSSCLPIPVPESDEIHKGMKCLDFMRSITDKDMKCPNYPEGPAQQINSVTASLDLSYIYGTTNEALMRQRSLRNGRLAMEKRYNSTWPLHEPNTKDACFSWNSRETCYISGDPRINQNPTLSIVQILFIREHNRIAKELRKLNPHWNDELLFQESRRINIAEFQSIAYYGWFTAIVGPENVNSLGYYYQPSGSEYANDYDKTIDPSIYNEFPSGVFRLLHTVIDGSLQKLSESGQLEGVVRLSDFYHRPKAIEGYGNFDSLLRGLLQQPAQFFDRNYDPEIRSYLFRMQRKYGSDLKALDIQRGRDHGLANYNELRSFCGLKRATKWEDFADHIPMSDVENLRRVYADVEDVDLNVGSSLEKPIGPDSLIGYTYTCLLKIQVKNLRITDRYWFENNDPAARFTPNQLAELRKASFTRIICDNTESIFTVPKNPFFVQEFTPMSRMKLFFVIITDRYWFENNDPDKNAARFTPNQLAELRKASFTRIICDNTESIFTVPKNPFFVQGYKNNTFTKCSDLPKVDLSLFKE
ncbi:peroxidase-like [Chironomus tepperi]|uniref:peroxidase-like n=1 Tax=Chironomus tepperi TaxID=113505 RepID=UPI00391EF0B3